jgi:hypothetical protein
MRNFGKILLIFLLFLNTAVNGQTLSWDAGFDGFLDNREYFSIGNPQTIFGARAWGEIGADFNEYHQIRGGINQLKEFGEDVVHLPDLTMYYQFADDKLQFAIGAFPRRDKLNYPLAFLSDTLNYYRPNIQGVLLGLNHNRISQHLFIDWMSRQTDTRYERFMFSTSGKINFHPVFIENYLLMNHLAGKAIPEPGFHLRDNGGASIMLGFNASDYAPIDSLVFKTGGILSIDRTRGVDPGFQYPAGFMVQFEARHNIFGISGSYYRGEGHTFFYGDPFYKLKEYGRLDLHLLSKTDNKLKLDVNFSLHLSKGQLDYSQQLLLYVVLNE